MQAQIQEVHIETVTKGRNTYQVADVVYTSNGRNSKTKIFSFANPAVFSTLQTATPGSAWDVEMKKNGEFWNWVAMKPTGQDNAPATPAAKTTGYTGGKVTGSNYETPEERKLRQMYIIKQSSIGHAVELLGTGAKTPASVESVLEVAQQFVDFVYGNPMEPDILSKETPNDLEDVPY